MPVEMSVPDASMLLPALAIVLGLIGIAMYRLIRPRFNVTVSCWFCHQESVVPYENRNCWDCLRCEQYNGFLVDGSYNKDIPAQHIEDLNHHVSACERGSDSVVCDNGLCEMCNRNQELKVRQLANFVPYDEANFDVEIASYSKHLEDIYQLCDRCSAHVDAVLQQQNSALSIRLLNERLRKTASEHSYSSTSRSHSGTQGSHQHLLPSEQWSRRLSLASALDCLAAVCSAATAVGCGMRLAPPGSDVATSFGHVRDCLRPLAIAALSMFRTDGLFVPVSLPFAFEDLTILFIFTGFAAELVSLSLRGLQRLAGTHLLVGLAWCSLLASICLPSAGLGVADTAAVQLLCAAIAIVATIAGRRCSFVDTKASCMAKARRQGRCSPSLSGFDSPTSDGRSYNGGLVSPSEPRFGSSRSQAFGSSGRRVASSASDRIPSEAQPLTFDVHSSLSRLRLDAAAGSSSAYRSHVRSHAAKSTSSVYSFRSAATEPVIKPSRMAAAASMRAGLAHPTTMKTSGSVRSSHTTIPNPRRLADSPTDRGSSVSVLSGRLCSNVSPGSTYCEDGTASWHSGSYGSYHTVGFSPSIANQVFRGTISSNGLLNVPKTNGTSPEIAAATKPLFAKAVIIASVCLNATAVLLLARQQQIF